MKSATLLQLLTLGGLTTACNHQHDDKEWTKEQLDELEAKWGFEVRWPTPLEEQRFLGSDYSSGLLEELEPLLISTTSSALLSLRSHSTLQSSVLHLTQV